ncbi:MAG: TetR/AcrR family transcriptional regulator [Rhodococcus sp.]|nr:TetR/AcrR family transcriptional regulator [Rhodococcus sp. (in: high G+C Gram-positive bacteria)]
MARPAGPGRRALIDAGMTLAEDGGVAALSVSAVTTTAGMAKGSFYQHFPDRRSYIIELHRSYHDQLAEVVAQVISEFDPGIERLRAGLDAFLNACLQTRGTKAFLGQARTETDLGDEVAQRNAAFATLVREDLEAIGWSDAAPIATLAVAMAADVSFHELVAREPREDLRAAILTLVSRPVCEA